MVEGRFMTEVVSEFKAIAGDALSMRKVGLLARAR